MPNYNVDRAGADWWGRILGFGGLCVAAGALYYTYQQTRELPDRNQLNEIYQQNISQQVEAWNEKAKLAEATRASEFEQELTSLRRRADELINRSSEDLQATGENGGPDRGLSSEPRDQLAGDAPGATHDDTTPDAEETSAAEEPGGFAADAADDINRTAGGAVGAPPSPIVSTDSAPGSKLMLVTTAQRPIAGQPLITATLRNTGTAPSQIAYVEFFPKEVFEIPGEIAAQSLDATATGKLVVVYGSTENLTATAGKHGNYSREMSGQFEIPAGASVDLQIAIADARHLGWGLKGTVRIEDRSGDYIEIENASLPFVEPQPQQRNQPLVNPGRD